MLNEAALSCQRNLYPDTTKTQAGEVPPEGKIVKTMLLPCIYTKLVLCGLLRQCKSLAAQARSGRFRITPGYSYVRASAARWCI